MGVILTREQLEAAHCWEADDQIPRRPAMKDFRRGARYHQAKWREAHGHPIGMQPYVPRPGDKIRPVGSRVPLAYGHETGATSSAQARSPRQGPELRRFEPNQSFDHQRLWADLLSSEALAFNLFGDLAGDLGLADRAVHAWWSDAPGDAKVLPSRTATAVRARYIAT